MRTNQFYSIWDPLRLDGTRPRREESFKARERRSRMIIRDVPREIQQMLRRNDSGFESLAETYGKRGQLYWKVSAEARLSAEGSWCHRPATISHFPTLRGQHSPLTQPSPIYLSTTLLFARSRDRSSALIRDSFAPHDSSSVWRLLVENPINSSPRTDSIRYHCRCIIVTIRSINRPVLREFDDFIDSIVPIIADRIIIIWIIWIQEIIKFCSNFFHRSYIFTFI